MSIKLKSICLYTLLVAKLTGYTTQEILSLHYLAKSSLDKRWSNRKFRQLEKARMLAWSTGHWFEELRILMDEIRFIIKYQKNKNLFYTAKARIDSLDNIFSMDNGEFAKIFKEIYLSDKYAQINSQTKLVLLKTAIQLQKDSDYMLAHLQFGNAISCGKAICKIASLYKDLDLDDHIQAIFNIAIGYGNIREIGKAIEYYNKAITLAHNAEDVIYEYISIIRKLTVFITSNDISIHVDIDKERTDTLKLLFDLCEKYQVSLSGLGAKLLSLEISEKKKGLLSEAEPFLLNLLALQRGDTQTAAIYNKKIMDAEARNYGSDDFTNLEQMNNLYQMMHQSAFRDESTNGLQDTASPSPEEYEDIPFYMEFTKGETPAVRHNKLMQFAAYEIAQIHPSSAINLANQIAEVGIKAYSDYCSLMALTFIGQAMEIDGETEKAIKVYECIVKEFTNPTHPASDIKLSKQLLYNTLFTLGNIKREHDPKMAIEHFNQAEIYCKQSSDVDKDYFLLHILIGRADAYRNLEEMELMEQDCINAADLVTNQVVNRIKYLDSDLTDNLWHLMGNIIRNIISFGENQSSDRFRKRLYELVLFAKGFLLSSQQAMKRAVFSDGTPENIKKLYIEVEKYYQTRKPWGTSTEDSAVEYANNYMQRMQLTCAMSEKIEQHLDFTNTDFENLANSLKPDEIVIDFFEYDKDDDMQYIAFSYRLGDAAPQLLKICKESEMDTVFNSSLYHLIFDKIIEKMQVENSCSLYVVPSGSIHKIPFESLVTNEDTGIIASDFFKTIARISHAREIRNLTGNIPFNSINLFGGLDYGCIDDENSLERGYKLQYNENGIAILEPWKKLKWSLQEINNISFLWRSIKPEATINIYSGTEGTPDKFYDLDSKVGSIIHFATHGFYETPHTCINLPALYGKFNPMDLSGIVLSNGNKGWLYGSPMHHEGILTSSDIAKKNLQGISLVVLSTCNSGNGKISNDGIYGLQRAFKKAGARSILMSLWNESDQAGALFMTTFYHYLLTEGATLYKAFNHAKSEVRKKFPDPQYWANFILLD